MPLKSLFYNLKPIIPRKYQLYLRRRLISIQKKKCKDTWPIDESAGKSPKGWNGWPDGKKFSLVLTHDVETQKGHDCCKKLLEIEESLGLKSSYNFVPERYEVSAELRKYIESRGFEVGVHGLCHDGKLYKSKEIFKERAIKINKYLEEWGNVGFRSPSMHCNLEWIHDLNILYDASTYDTDPFEPRSSGVKTIFPFWVSDNINGTGYVELPYTLAQDFTLLVLLEEKCIDIWKKKIDWIAEKGGMALINIHPDYINFDGHGQRFDEYSINHYVEFLNYIKEKFNGQYWQPLSKEIASFWKNNYIS